MTILATVIILYAFARQAKDTLNAYRDGHTVWVGIMAALALSLFIPLWMVWQ